MVWLKECTDICIFYINKTLIPIVVSTGPRGSLVCTTPMDPEPCSSHPHGPGLERDFPLSVLDRLPCFAPTVGSGLGFL